MLGRSRVALPPPKAVRRRGAIPLALALVAGLLASIPASPAAAQEDPPQPTCVDLVDDHTGEAVGEVCAVDEDGVLSVEYSTFDGWVMTDTRLAVSADEPGPGSEWAAEKWANPAGNVSTGQFPYSDIHDPATDSFTYEIPLSEISGGVGHGDELSIAARALAQRKNITAFIESATIAVGDELFELPSCPDGIAPDDETQCLFLHGYEFDGTYVVPSDRINIPALEDEVSLPIVGTQPLTVTFQTPQGISGILDRGTGEVTVDMPLEIFISIGTLTQPNCRLPNISIHATTGESGALTGSPLMDDRATVVDGLFPAPGATGCGTIFIIINLNTQINNQLNLPQPSGNNALEFNLLFAEGHLLPTTHEVVAPGLEDSTAWGAGERFRQNHPASFFRHTLTSDPAQPGSISGTVTDASTEAPIAGATVTADGHETTTGPDGTYTLADLEPGSYEVTAFAEGYESASQNVEVGDGEDVTGVDFALTPVAAPQPGSISGTVTDASTEAPIEGATVTADGHETTTDENGNYTLADLEPDTYEVTASAEGYESASQNVEVGDGEDVTGVDFALEPVVVEPQPGSISGTVTDASTEAPIEGATVTADGHETTTGPDGTYTLADLQPGSYEVTASAEGYESASQNVEVGDGEDVTGVDFALDPVVVEPQPGSISGTVTDADTEAPIEGATVETDAGHSTSTDENGNYTLADVDPGTYEVTASADGYHSASQTVEVGDGEDVTGVDFALDPVVVEPQPGSISGTVTDADTEAPIEGATVETDAGHSTSTDENGNYTLADVDPGTYEVTASADGYFPSDPVTVEVGDGEDVVGVDFALVPVPPDPGSISGTVTDADTEAPIEGATVVTDQGHEATTDENGEYLLADLEPDTYQLTASADGYFIENRIVVVGEGEDLIVNFALVPIPPDPGSISGTVTDASTGAPIEGATVTANSHETTTNEDGEYTLANLTPGTYEVTASADGYESDSQTVEVGDGEDVVGVDFALTPLNGSISGTVTDASTEAPIEGATVETDAGHSATTDEDGEYTIADVEPGSYEVTASADGYESDSQSVNVGPGQDVTGVDFALTPLNGSISGTVTDASTTAPIEGATVETDQGHSATTGPDGSYTIADVEPGSYEVTASADGYESDSQSVNVGPGQDVTGVDFALTPIPPDPGSISGTVTDASTEAPIEGATVTANGHEATTNAAGEYTIANLTPGTYEVTASAAGYESDSQTVEVGDGEDVVGVDFALTPLNGSISGTVTDASTTAPIEGATVETDQGHSATTGPDGSYTIADVEPGTYEVTASAEGYESDSQSVNVGPGQDVTGVDFALTPLNGSISGTVTDASTTAPIEGATVETDQGHSATTGPDGSYTIADVEPGSYEVTASAAGYFSQSQNVDVGPGEDVTGVNFALEAIPPQPGSISGTVTDASTEAPIEGATVETDGGHSTTTDENGNYSLADVMPGTYEVTASADGYESDSQTVEVGDGEDVVGVDFALTPVAAPPLIVPGPFTATAEGGELTVGALDTLELTGCPDGVPPDPETECITFTGEVLDEDGNFLILADDVDFPVLELEADESIPLDLAIIITAADDVTGQIDPVTGEGTLNVNLSVDIDIGQTGEGDCRMSLGLSSTTGTSGALTGSPLNEDGRISIVDGLFAIPVAAPISPVGAVLCGLVNDAVGLPSPSGDNEVRFDLLITQP